MARSGGLSLGASSYLSDAPQAMVRTPITAAQPLLPSTERTGT